MYKVETVIASSVQLLGSAIQDVLNRNANYYDLNYVTQSVTKGGMLGDNHTAVIILKKK